MGGWEKELQELLGEPAKVSGNEGNILEIITEDKVVLVELKYFFFGRNTRKVWICSIVQDVEKRQFGFFRDISDIFKIRFTFLMLFHRAPNIEKKKKLVFRGLTFIFYKKMTILGS